MAITNIRPNPFVPEYQEEIIEDAAVRRMKMFSGISTALDDGEEGENSLEDALENLRNIFIDSSEEEPYVDPKFAYNPGAFTINKAPEDITVQDVINAYELEDLFDGIPLLDVNTDNDKETYPYILIGEETTKLEEVPSEDAPPYIITGEAAGLIWGKEVNGVEVPYYTLNHINNVPQPIALKARYITNDVLAEHKGEKKLNKTSGITVLDIAIYNAKRMKMLKSNCAGIKLEHIYPLYYKNDFATDNIEPQTQKEGENKFFEPKRDFIIDGEVNGEAKGGFVSHRTTLCTSHSLYLHKVHWLKPIGWYWTILVDCSKDGGVDQLKVDGCVFEGIGTATSDPHSITNEGDGYNYGEFYCREGRCYAGRFIFLYFTFDYAWDNNTQQLVQKNLLKHLYFYDNVVYGCTCVGSKAARFVETCRYINNCFYMGTMSDNYRNGYYVKLSEYKKWTLCPVAIDHGAENNKTDKQGNSTNYGYKIVYMTYYSCPMWFVGNKFFGSPEIMVERSMKSSINSGYYGGIITETSSAYILWNTFKNFVTRTSIRTTDSTARVTRPETYDCYTSNIRVYHCNNHITNVLHISPYKGVDIGLAKGKNITVPSAYQYSDFYDVIKYYKNNIFDVDKDWIDAAWSRGINDGMFYGVDTFISAGNEGEKEKAWADEILAFYRIEDVMENGEVKSISKAKSQYEWALDLPRNERPATYYKMFGEKSWDMAMSITETINGEEVVTGVNPDFIYYVMACTKEFDDTPLAVSEFTFSNNTFNMGEGCIGGMRSNAYFYCVKFICQDNEFHTSKAVSTIGNEPPAEIEVSNAFWQAELSYAGGGGPDEAIFNVLLTDLYKVRWDDISKQVVKNNSYSPSIVMTGNKFYIDSQEQNSNYVPVWVRMLKVSIKRPWEGFANYTKEEILPMANYSESSDSNNFIGKVMVVKNNLITQPESSTVRNGLVISFKNEKGSLGAPIKITAALEPDD